MKIYFVLLATLITAVILTGCQPTIVTENEVVVSSSLPPEDPTESIDPIPTFIDPPQPTDTPKQKPPGGADREFTTDFSITSIDFSEILSGGVPKDGIPAIRKPKFVNIEDADIWLAPQEPVIQVVMNEVAKAYPIQILMWHEIVNDEIGGVPVLVTFCPLCNTAIAFERTVNGNVFDFGTTGRLRFSNLIMYDRQTETWWQQAEGKGIVGKLTGTQLVFVPAAIISWEEFKNANPNGLVLSRETGFVRNYGFNPYVGYDDVNRPPFLYQGPETPDKLPPVARVLTVEIEEEAVAYPYELLREVNVVNDTVGGQQIAVFWSSGTVSALDTLEISDGKDIGTAIAFSRLLNGTVLTFKYDGQNIVDEETTSTWDVLGKAISGELAGKQLEQAVSINHFWFSWVAFKPETRVYQQ
ncbi:MAG: hypothetical protein CVU41_19225 [Chloroflexi bacterium HGW-Chloroflexi-3]|nr:MAG: hypothetical protein CVU41_19225 [Chloroflexi bacterium HGW-Chloroflexi-3]